MTAGQPEGVGQQQGRGQWIHDELRRAKERSDSLPSWARPVVTRPYATSPVSSPTPPARDSGRASEQAMLQAWSEAADGTTIAEIRKRAAQIDSERDSGRECPRSSDCEAIPGRGCWTHMQPTPPSSPLAQDSGRTVDGYGRNIGACTECHTAPSECTGPEFCCEDCLHLDEGWEGYEPAPVDSSGRDEAREAVARWLWRQEEGALRVDRSWNEPRFRDLRRHFQRKADELLALPELDKLLRRPA